MTRIILISLLVVTVCSAYDCNKSKVGKLRGKLVVKELCSHYVVQVIEGTVDTSMVENNWKDEKRKQSFDKVFTVANRCNFPSELKEGEEFEFMFDPNPPAQNCAVCMAFYPTPAKTNAIKISSGK